MTSKQNALFLPCVSSRPVICDVRFSEKLNIKFVPAEARAGLLTSEERARLKKVHEENKQLLRIPRR